jgi:S-adenosylmethionine synthetase
VLTQPAYAIGVAELGKLAGVAEGLTPQQKAERTVALRRKFELAPGGITRYLALQGPTYYLTVA